MTFERSVLAIEIEIVGVIARVSPPYNPHQMKKGRPGNAFHCHVASPVAETVGFSNPESRPYRPASLSAGSLVRLARRRSFSLSSRLRMR